MSGLTDTLMETTLGQLFTVQEASALAERAERKEMPSGVALFKAGDAGDALYVVVQGSFDVLLGAPDSGAPAVAQIGVGQVVGELEVMTGSLRMATLRARETTAVLALSAKAFHSMLAENHPASTKLVTHIAKTLARRLAAVNQRITEKPVQKVQASDEPVEIDSTDIIEEVGGVDDADLDVLDKLWS